MNKQRIFVTGATGFVGQALLAALGKREQNALLGGVRRPAAHLPGGAVPVIGDLTDSDWLNCLNGVDVAVHCAALTAVTKVEPGQETDAFRRVNVEGTLQLARSAAKAGVGRFVFISTVKMLGESTPPGNPFTESTAPKPEGAYAQSKLEAERALLALGKETGMEVVVIRPPLVYGLGVGGNFASMIRWLSKGVPLPLGAVDNRRSLVGLDNLVDFIVRCIEHPGAADQVFLVSDDADLSTSELLRKLAHFMGRTARLVPFPPRWLERAAMLMGKREVARRLLGSLQMDISKARDVLGWSPPISVDEGFRRAVGSQIQCRSGFSRDD